jgi:pyruvate ferredoxin oxidoreductase gamma subunit
MYRIRFHGRGGQGMKTASRIPGTAFFLEAYEVQDAPRYGAERRGAPIFAYVRASRETIHERGIIGQPERGNDTSFADRQYRSVLGCAPGRC